MDMTELQAKLQVVSDGLDAANTTLGKVSNETSQSLATITDQQAQIQALKDLLAQQGSMSPEVEALVNGISDKAAALAAGLTTVDNLVPDAAP